MDEREVECSRCDNTTIMTQENIPTGWIFVETGWEEIDYMIFCPRCKERYLKHRLTLGAQERKYPVLVMYPCE